MPKDPMSSAVAGHEVGRTPQWIIHCGEYAGLVSREQAFTSLRWHAGQGVIPRQERGKQGRIGKERAWTRRPKLGFLWAWNLRSAW